MNVFINKISEFAQNNKLAVGIIQYPEKSVMGTSSICVHVKDGEGLFTAIHQAHIKGRFFYVPSGIDWFYKSVLKGSQSQIGLPISNELASSHEERVKQVRFEKGAIEYDSLTNTCKAMSVFKASTL